MHALRVHDDVHAGDPRPDVGHATGREPAVHRAVPAPEDHRRVPQLLRFQAAGLASRVRIPHHAVVQAQAELQHRGVAAEVLVRQEQHLAALGQRPAEGLGGVGRGAHGSAVPAGERLDVGGGVHVCDGNHLVGESGVLERIPALLDLVVGGHVGHRAARRQVRQHDPLLRRGQDVGGLGHEVDAAEDHELRLRPGCGLPGQLERVPGHVGELDDLVPLVVVAENERPVAECGPGRPGPGHQIRVARRRQLAGALHAALAGRIGTAAEHQQRQAPPRCRHRGADLRRCAGLAGWCRHESPRSARLIVVVTIPIIASGPNAAGRRPGGTALDRTFRVVRQQAVHSTSRWIRNDAAGIIVDRAWAQPCRRGSGHSDSRSRHR